MRLKTIMVFTALLLIPAGAKILGLHTLTPRETLSLTEMQSKIQAQEKVVEDLRKQFCAEQKRIAATKGITDISCLSPYEGFVGSGSITCVSSLCVSSGSSAYWHFTDDFRHLVKEGY